MIGSNAFESLINLKELEIHRNRLKKIDPNWFQPLKSIGFISLFENNFDSVFLSFFDKNLVPGDFGIEFHEKFMLINGDFYSDWSLFLKQFGKFSFT